MPFRLYRAVLAALLLGLATLPLPARADTPLTVVTSFSILADIARAIGGERVTVESLIEAGQDAHGFEPRPSDIRRLSEADLVIVNGLGFEGWLERLPTSAPVIVASRHAAILEAGEDDHGAHEPDHGPDAHEPHDHDPHDHGPMDPHAWQSPLNGLHYAETIAEALATADPQGSAVYETNLEAYRQEILAIDGEWRSFTASLDRAGRTVVTAHAAFNYLAHAYDLHFLTLAGIETEGSISAHDLAHVIEEIQEEGVRAVFFENISDERLLQQITSETDAVIGGTLYSDALSGPDGPAPTYLALLRHNLSVMRQALAPMR